MTDPRGQGPAGPPPPRSISALLEELAATPEVQPGSGIAPGKVIGDRFEVLREIGRGGFGIVFEARDRELGRLVAVKVVHPRRGVDLAMIRTEAEAAAALHHPNIVTLHDLGSAGGEGWLVLELLRGETLEERLRRGPLPRDEALRVATEVARGLAHAHRAGVLHRDLKPSNVFLCDDGAVKILDFGLSRVFGSGSGPEGGTPAYMAPEQWRREGEDERTDVFALGVMLHEMLTGQRPFAVESGRSTALDDGPVPELPAGAAPRKVRALARRSVSRAPGDRPRDGAAVLEALLAARSDGETGGRRRRVALAGGMLLVAVLGAVAAWRAFRVPDLAPGQRIPVAVADFQNGTSDPELNGLSEMLTTSLEQSKRLLVVTRSRLADLIRQTGKEVPERIDESLARQVGKLAGVKALLLATVHRFDDLYAIEMRALDPATDQYLFTLKAEGRGKASIPGMIDRLSGQTRERLREAPRDLAGGRAVADLTTANLAAYEHYFRARQAMDAWRPDTAIQELDRAIAIDPQFALARYQRALVDAWTPAWLKFAKTGDEAATRTLQEHLAAAMRLVDRLPEKERLSLAAWKATLDKRPEEARRLRDQAAEAFPQDKEAVFWGGDVRFHAGGYAEAVPYFERAVKLDPAYALALDHLAQSYDALGDPEKELEAARRWAAVSGSFDSHRWVARALLSLDRRDEAESELRRAAAVDPSRWPLGDLVSWLLYQGRPHEGEAMAREGLRARAKGGATPAPSEPHEDDLRQVRLVVQALLQQGRHRDARALVEALPGQGFPLPFSATLRTDLGIQTGSAELVRSGVDDLDRAGLLKGARPALGAATALAFVNDLGAARAMAGRARAAPDWAEVEPGRSQYLDTLVAFREGRDGEAEAAIRVLAGSPLAGLRYSATFWLGRLLVQTGRDAEGAAALERARAMRWSGSVGEQHPWLDPQALLLLAGAKERLGDRQAALDAVDALLRNWDRADSDLPGLADARAMRKRLAPKTAQATQR